MNKWEAAFKTGTALLGAACGFLFGGWSVVLQFLLIAAVADYVTGFLASGIEGKLSSRVGYKGIRKKAMIFIVVALSHWVDKILGQSGVIREAVAFFYIANELLSILENVGRAGLPIPDVLRRAIEILKGKGDPK